MPRHNEVAVLVEYLNATIPTVGNINTALCAADEDVVRLVELTGCSTFAAPCFDKLAVFGEFHNASGAELVGVMAIRHEDVAIRRDGDAGRPVERIRTIAGHSLLAKHHQNLAVRADLEHLLAHHDAGGVPGRHAEHCFTVVDIARPKVPFV